MKKLLTVALLFLVTVGAQAQFEKGTKFVGASLSGLELSYNSVSDFKFGLQAEAGYFFADNWMVKGNVGYGYQYKNNTLDVGALARYYIKNVGLFLGAGAEYSYLGKNALGEGVSDFAIPVQLGYCFYLNDHVSIEPAAYYKMSLIDFANNSEVGLRIGFSYYF